MTTPPPSIFRSEALEYRLRNQGHRRSEVSFPRLMAGRFMIGLWIVLGVLGLGGAAACLPTVPVSAAGMAIMTSETWAETDAPVVAVLMLPDYRDRIEPGHSANVLLGAGWRGLDGTIVAVEPGTLTPEQLETRLGLASTVLSTLPGPMALAWVTLDEATREDMGMATMGRADLDVGESRAGTFLPLVGRFFEE